MNTNDTKTTTLRLPVLLYEKIQKEAERLNITVSAMLKIIISKHYSG